MLGKYILHVRSNIYCLVKFSIHQPCFIDTKYFNYDNYLNPHCVMKPTKQNDVIMLLSSVIRPLMALLMSIFDVRLSPQANSKDATFSASHSSGQPVNQLGFC